MIEYPVCNYENQQSCTWYIHTDKHTNNQNNCKYNWKNLRKVLWLPLDFQGGGGKGKSQ